MKIFLLAGVIPAFLGACSAPPAPLPDVSILQKTASPNIAALQPENKSVVQGYEHRTPTDPKSWRELNDQQSSGAS